MSKIHLGDLEDYYEDEGHDVCFVCGSLDFEWDDETQGWNICSNCGEQMITAPKKDKRKQHKSDFNLFGEGDYDDLSE